MAQAGGKGECLVNKDVQVSSQLFSDTGDIPNNKKLPFLVYKGVVQNTEDAEAVACLYESLLAKNGWHDMWRDTVYPYPHYHSTAHEALGIYRGSATIQIGGEGGKLYEVKAGDFCVVPVGVGHMRIKSTEDFAVVGGYPKGTSPDINYGKPAQERPKADENIAKVQIPETDPLFGAEGHLVKLWKK